MGGFDCPCHAPRFDLAGRVFRNVPAPLNLEVPPCRYFPSRHCGSVRRLAEGGTCQGARRSTRVP